MNYTEIKQFADDLLDTSDTKFPVARKTRFANRANERVLSLILSADSSIQFDDRNHTSQAVGTFDITSGQRSYTIKTDEGGYQILRVFSVAIKDSNGIWKDVTAVDIRDPLAQTIRLQSGGTGVPSKYDFHGNTITFDVEFDYTSAGGGKVYFERMIPLFEDESENSPGYDEHFHVLIPMWMAYWEGFKRMKSSKRRELRNDIKILEDELREHYSTRDSDYETVMEPEVIDPR
jgi:hypothetical protein